jgi:NhaP-type Na+/H+ or K+/H+ antiporter
VTEHLLSLAAVIVLGVGAQWLAWRLRIPSIMLLLLVGFLAGPAAGELLGQPLLDPDRVFGDLLHPFVALAVALILYEGGLTLRFAELAEARNVVLRLVTIGAVLTWAGVAAAARWVGGLDWAMAVLLGAVLVVTGPTVIVPLLHQIRPRGRIGAVLRWEGIVIDPIGAMLAVLVFEVILLGDLDEAASHAAGVVIRTVAIGGGLGLLAGLVLALVLRWFWVPDYLDNAVSIMFVVGAYTGAQSLQPESGLLAATVMGITLANQRLVAVRHIVEFKENLRVLLISSLFILLSARLELRDVDRVGVAGILLVIAVILLRPAAVMLSMAGSPVSWREMLFASTVLPRGIVAAAVVSVFAPPLQEQGFASAGVLVPMTFLVIFGTVLYSSIVAPLAAQWVGVAEPHPQGVLLVGAHDWGRALAEALRKLELRVLVVDTNRRHVAAGRMAGLETCNESVLAEHLLDEVDLGGIGRLLAVTPNDWVNVLAVQRFARIFGRGEVYQVAARGRDADVAHRHLHGRWLFGESLTWEQLAARVRDGAVVKTTPITAEFTMESFRAHYGERAIPLFVLSASRRLTIVTADQPPRPGPGEILVSLVSAEPGGRDVP